MADTEIRTREDVTQEVLDLVWSYVEGWYMDTPIDWTDVLERAERSALPDGSSPDFGPDWDSPAIRRIKRDVGTMKREAQA